MQTIVVQDTTPPTNPTLVSPTHSTSVWSNVSTVTVDSSGATDVCSGVKGFSYVWSRDTTTTPDTVTDPATQTLSWTSTSTSTLDSQSFTDSSWPADWTCSDTTYVRVSTSHVYSGYSAEIYTDNNTLRTADFYRDYDLRDCTSATLSFMDSCSKLDSADYARAEYSTDGGSTWTSVSSPSGTSAWTARSSSLPVGGTVRVKFSASVNKNNEYADWDDITVVAAVKQSSTLLSTSTTTGLADGTWYFNLRSVDNASNWSLVVGFGPFLIDTVPPITTDDAPSGWSSGPVSVKLTPLDAGQIAYTHYSLNGGAATSYGSPVLISAEGTTTLSYYSADAAGHVEIAHSKSVRIDTVSPSTPATVSASAVSTSAVEVTWAASTDAASGVSGYRVYRDNVVIATTPGLTYTDASVQQSTTHSYKVVALDAAGNASASTASVSVTLPLASIWMTVSRTSVDMGNVEPQIPTALSSAVSVDVGGVGALTYDLSCSGLDFANSDSGSSTLTVPASLLGFTTRGWASAPFTTFQNGSVLISSSIGSKYIWDHQYVFDYTLTVPMTVEAGTYAGQVIYTAVAR